MPTDQTVLRMHGIEKRYGAVTALRGVDFDLRRGEVMALLGENGAGKSTLVKILAGLEREDAGRIEIGGHAVRIRSPRQSLQAGVAYVAQELSIVGALSVAENICIGGTTEGAIWNPRRLAASVRPYLSLVGLGDVDPGMLAGRLSVAQQQLLEIARLLSRNARILILDEPTAALSDVEIEKVKAVVRTLADEGRSIIYVTHRLGEVFEIGDRVTIFRNGQSFDALRVADLDVEDLIEHMLGRRLNEMFPPRGGGGGPPTLTLRGLRAPGLAAPVNLQLKRGQIVGLAGQLGSGANAVLRVIAGVLACDSGEMMLIDQPVRPRSVREAIAHGIAYCSDDRKRDGIFGVRTVRENLTAPSLRDVTPGGLVHDRREDALARRLASFFEIAANRLGTQAGKLSGGNQQKVALGKWLGVEPTILLVEEPTRGVDVGARTEIYRHLRTLADRGMTILFASSDNQEVLGLADTVVTFFRGRLVRVADAATLPPEELLRDVTHPDLADLGRAA